MSHSGRFVCLGNPALTTVRRKLELVPKAKRALSPTVLFSTTIGAPYSFGTDELPNSIRALINLTVTSVEAKTLPFRSISYRQSPEDLWY